MRKEYFNIEKLWGDIQIQETQHLQSQVKRHRIHFFLEENIKAIYKKCNKTIKLAVLKDMIKDLDNEK